MTIITTMEQLVSKIREKDTVLDVRQNLGEIGLSSLELVHFTVALEQEYHCELNAAVIEKMQTIGDLIKHIQSEALVQENIK